MRPGPHPRLDPLRPVIRAGQRGFSLIELMVVVIIIAALAVVAVPQATKQMRARRTQQTAQMVANLYRTARMRALGRGSAMLVRFTAANQGRLEMREAVQPDGNACPNMPVSSCLTTTWLATTGNTGDNNLIDFINAANPADDQNPIIITAQGAPGGPSAATAMDVCYSPAGRTFARYATTGAWFVLTGVPTVTVTREDGNGHTVGLIRNILLLPNGAVRMGVAR